MSSTQKLDLSNIKNQIEASIGGALTDSKALQTSFEGLEKALDLIPLGATEPSDSPDRNSLVKLITDDGRIDFLKAYTEREAKVVNQIANDLKPVFTPKDEIIFARTMQAYSQVSQRLLKISNLMSAQPAEQNESILLEEETTGSTDQKMQEIAKISKESLSNSYAKIFNIIAKNIDSVPENEEGQDRLENFTELLKALGIMPMLKNNIMSKSGRMPREQSTATKNKKRIITRLLRAISIAQLPAVSEDQIVTPGGYFKLFSSLDSKNPAWMNLSIESYVFGKGNTKEIAEFNASARKEESISEENQINYLRASRSWILSYIKGDSDGTLTDKEEANYVSQLETTVIEKEKEIKNYYLSKSFNLSSVQGIQIKPEIKLPLYVKVRLAVTDADRLKESPLRNIVGGVLSAVGGLFAHIETKIDAGEVAAAKARNEAIFKGISALVKGTVGLVGGKQAARDYEEGVDKLASTLNPERITLSKDEKKGRIKEDMVAPIGSNGMAPVGTGSPGQFMQTPDAMAGSMDTFSLLGPGKKTKPKKKSKVAGSKVLTFADFIKGKGKVD